LCIDINCLSKVLNYKPKNKHSCLYVHLHLPVIELLTTKCKGKVINLKCQSVWEDDT